MLWLLGLLAAIFSFISLFVSYKIIKKFDDFQIASYEAFELLNNDRVRLLKEIEALQAQYGAGSLNIETGEIVPV
jgi:uncharacterized membrane protein